MQTLYIWVGRIVSSAIGSVLGPIIIEAIETQYNYPLTERLSAMVGGVIGSDVIWWLSAALTGVFALAIWERHSKRKFQTRHLNKSQKKRLAEALGERKLNTDDITVRFAAGNDECREYAEDFSDVLRRLGWSKQSGTTLDEESHITGLRLVVESLQQKPVSSNILADAFREVGIDFDWLQASPPLTSPVILYQRR